jgi:hypothetical protein
MFERIKFWPTLILLEVVAILILLFIAQTTPDKSLVWDAPAGATVILIISLVAWGISKIDLVE